MSSPQPSVAVAIPCYNEAPAITAVVADYRRALPDALIVVFDNNSTDGTGDLARGLGVRVEDVPEQGKGHAVRAAFKTLADHDVVVLTDGDGTYPASEAHRLIELVVTGRADMAVGARRPVAGAGAMTLIRRVGNLLIRAAFRIVIGPGNTDLLSGYRAFSKTYRQRVELSSSGFEIETELASEAVARGLVVVEIPIPYHPRIAGTESKLSAVRDGIRIARTILRQGWRLKRTRLWLLLILGYALLLMPFTRNLIVPAIMLALFVLTVLVDWWRSRARAVARGKIGG